MNAIKAFISSNALRAGGCKDFRGRNPECGFLTRSDAADGPFMKNPNLGIFISTNLCVILPLKPVRRTKKEMDALMACIPFSLGLPAEEFRDLRRNKAAEVADFPRPHVRSGLTYRPVPKP